MLKRILLASVLSLYAIKMDYSSSVISNLRIHEPASEPLHVLVEPLSNPFILGKGNNWSLDDEIILNERAVGLIEKTIPHAILMQKHQDSINFKYSDLKKLLLEELIERDAKTLRKHNKIRNELYLSKNKSLFALGKEKLSFNKNNYSSEINSFLQDINYFGTGVTRKKHDINFKQLFKKNNMSGTDCITYIQDCLTLGTNENFNGRKYDDALKLGKKLRQEGYETIFVAQNSISTDNKYRYRIGKDTTNLVAHRIKRIKANKYYVPVDYIVTDSNFMNPSFENFLNSSRGFVFMQEGNHVGFLINGDFCHALQKANPLYEEVFKTENLHDVMDNDNPRKDYQSALILLPKGSVEKYLKENKIEYLPRVDK